MRVMIVDDSNTMRALQRKMLKSMGVEDVVEACNGYEALTAFRTAQPDLILLDWNMPMMDGLTFLRCIRNRKRSISVVMITSEAEQRHVLEAVQLGAADYIVKPFTSETFSQKLGRFARPALAG